jgi:hypothetical protein
MRWPDAASRTGNTARQLRAAAHVAQEALDDAVLERVEADHHQAPADGEHRQRRIEQIAKVIELAVDANANRLEGARRRVLVLFPARMRLAHHGGELRRARQRSLVPRAHDGRGDALGVALLAVVPQHRGDIALVGNGQPVRRRLAAAAIHAHIQGTVVLKTEAALGTSSCGLETPRSRRMPSTHPAAFVSSMRRQIGEGAAGEGKPRIVGGELRASRSASSSLSQASRRPSGARRRRISRLCPPRPKVPST